MQFGTKHVAKLVGDGLSSQLLFEIIHALTPESKELTTLLKAIAKTANDGAIVSDDAPVEGIEGSLLGHPVGHRFAKRVLEKTNPFGMCGCTP